MAAAAELTNAFPLPDEGSRTASDAEGAEGSGGAEGAEGAEGSAGAATSAAGGAAAEACEREAARTVELGTGVPRGPLAEGTEEAHDDGPGSA